MRRPVFLLLLVLGTVHRAAAPADAAERAALVVGNANYQGADVLRNPANDAEAMGKALSELGFLVFKRKDLNLSQMEDALVDFRRKLTKGGLGLFYYAGHGLQVQGENYLVPIGARLREEFEVKSQCLKLEQVLAAMAESECNLKVIVLDSCRDNPLKRSWSRSSSGKGLASISNVPEGTVIAFSTSPNMTAEDGYGSNSPYTKELVEVLHSRPEGGLELSEVFREASRAVKRKTGQTPWLNLEASLEKYYLWSHATTLNPRPEPKSPAAEMPAPAEQVQVSFQVRDGSREGPELQGAEVQLRHRTAEGAVPTVLGLGVSDAQGRAQITLSAMTAQRTGAFQAVVSAGGMSKTWSLEDFPQARRWTLWLPRATPTPPSEGGRLISNSIGMKLALIPAGEFEMGSPDSESARRPEEGPQHRVRITKAFFMGVTEVTQAQYEQVMGTNPSEFKGDPQLPVEQVTWDEAAEFCRRLSQKEGKTYALPSEAQWEYACRAGSLTKWCFGGHESSLREYAWYFENSDRRTHPVGQKRPNGWGLFDMHGNVQEWCADWYNEEYRADAAREDPTGPTSGAYRVGRGGCWGAPAGMCRSASRLEFLPTLRFQFLGLRVLLVPAE